MAAQLSLLGVSAAQITRRTRMPRAQVDAALTVAGSKLAKAATERYDFLTLDQAATVAEFFLIWTRRGTPTCDRRHGAVARCGSWWSGTTASYAGCA